ncbi:MAG: helix-turn-helix domain containing protein [Gemmatimonadetes bacterium]|nr:helix-turn-helix domain containing protein [Gemmatimonadota bacterium]
MRIVSNVTSAMLRVARQPTAPLSRQACARLGWLDWHARHGHNVSRTCRRFGLSRETFYRWKRRYDPYDLRTLEDRSSRPKKRRRPTWTLEQVHAVKALREQYPCWGKDKLAVLLRRQGLVLSVSMVGRILTHLKRTGQLVEPVGLRRIRARPFRGRTVAAALPRKGAQAQGLRGGRTGRSGAGGHVGRAAGAGGGAEAVHGARRGESLGRAGLMLAGDGTDGDGVLGGFAGAAAVSGVGGAGGWGQ